MPIEISTDIIILAGFILILSAWIIRLEVRFQRLTRGENGKSLEGVIRQIGTGQQNLEHFRSEIETYLKDVERRLSRSVQGVATVRFDAFAGTGEGGKQSFATAFFF